MLTEKQTKLIELLVAGAHDIQACCDMALVKRSTYYYWQNNNKAFQEAYNDAIELKVNRAKQNIRRNVDVYLNRLDKLSETGANENARVNAIAKLLTLAELDPQFKQEVTIKTDDSDSKNYMMEMLNKKKDEE